MHGDLTTSNMLVHADLAANAATAAAGDAPALPTKVFLIDFGLSFFSDLVEDRSVDFYVMERAVQTTHAHSEHLIHMVYNTYKNKNVLGNKVMTRLNDVRARGRKKSMIG
jgi:TP53 regulating kinase-like protein